ncbi:hypothetical protein [Nocardioides pantholopis]|uniref:hypothetical protein n=1 Tax=Nocardioides pantholopis TaxID=2483798 RepID=UPI000FD83990|nr:hypothetical protein [Nocardioides pantholopis]
MTAYALTFTLSAGQVSAGIVAAAGLLGAIGYLVRLLRRAGRYLGAIHNVIDQELTHNGDGSIKSVIEQELTHNHGSSIKDDVHGLTVAVGGLSRLVDDIDARLADHTHTRGPHQ